MFHILSFIKRKGAPSAKMVSRPVKPMPVWGSFLSSLDLSKSVHILKVCGRLGSSDDVAGMESRSKELHTSSECSPQIFWR